MIQEEIQQNYIQNEKAYGLKKFICPVVPAATGFNLTINPGDLDAKKLILIVTHNRDVNGWTMSGNTYNQSTYAALLGKNIYSLVLNTNIQVSGLVSNSDPELICTPTLVAPVVLPITFTVPANVYFVDMYFHYIIDNYKVVNLAQIGASYAHK